jgi:hypothetical protein|tara:strand:+ start:5637 stop:6605 length:969 start_codon:yes stop_codon:yes gene_type:complete
MGWLIDQLEIAIAGDPRDGYATKKIRPRGYNMIGLQDKIDIFLSGSDKIPASILKKASDMFAQKLEKFHHVREKSSRPSLSQVGKPFCQLHAEKLDWPKVGEDISFSTKMLYGDMTETLMVAILLAAGVNITDTNRKVKFPLDDGAVLNGELDVIIADDNGDDPRVWDIKSASDFAFKKKFRSYDDLRNNDDFGYMEQLFGYTHALGNETTVGGWIVMNKVSGEIKVVEADQADYDSYVARIKQVADRYELATADNFKRDFTDEEELWYKKPTGNRKLGMTCGYCKFRETCWPGLRHEKNPRSKSATAFNFYTHFEDLDSVS